MQVKYPRFHVELNDFKTELNPKQAEEHRKRQLAGKKAARTKTLNQIATIEERISKARENWTQLFPMEETPHYIEAIAHIAKLRKKLSDAEPEL